MALSTVASIVNSQRQRMRYGVHTTQVWCLRWYPTKAQAIAAFERVSERSGTAPPECYPPGASGDSITPPRDFAQPWLRAAADS